MNTAKIVSKAQKTALESRYACINWDAHLVPIVQEAVEEFSRRLATDGYEVPHLLVRSEAVSSQKPVSSSYPGDTVSIRFGARPVATNSESPLGGNRLSP